ncbi:hypothetical protein [Devosia aurantiaca]|uniref:Uncharacterized protein n=1 Tax=Devosia aurantiaca TaxID=2714858 RepID=A0A6M1STD6_9HYPH|nr:hypothetical protein [Devosia aurantiaca]NGP18465.1 hypothetical protein [Devosia aurantiaca]
MNARHFVISSYHAAVAAANYYTQRQDHITAERYWRNANNWRRYAWSNGFDVPSA